MKLFECVPNVSEGRDAAVADACAQAISRAGATLANRTSDPVHHRSVFTFFGEAEPVLEAAVALARVTTERIDLRKHTGEHPRIGALDVLPFVPLYDASLEDAASVARSAGERIWAATGVPVFFYGAAAAREDYRQLPRARRGGFEGLCARWEAGDRPDLGDVALHPGAGAVAVGARAPLVAFNVVLASDDVRIARKIAATLRESGGGLRTLRALGIDLGDGRVQVSFNVTDTEALPLDRLVEVVRRQARRAGVAIAGTELIGLLPRRALATVAARRLGLDDPDEVTQPC